MNPKHHITKTNIKISDCLIQNFNLPLKSALELIELGATYIGENRVFEDQEMKGGDHLRVYLTPRRYHTKEVDWNSVIKKETSEYLVINKPGGIPTIATTDNGLENVLEQLRRFKKIPLFVTHRLDTPTSGLMVIAKTKPFQHEFNQWLQEGKIEKYYEAITEKNVALGPHIHYMAPGDDLPKRLDNELRKGWIKCLLEVLKVEPFKMHDIQYYRLQIRLHTGRTHQIRAQLSFLQAAVVGDREYGFKGKAPIVGKREIALKSVKLVFPNESIEVY